MSIRGIGDAYAFQRLLWLLIGTVIVPTALLAVYGTCAGDPNFNPAADFDGSGCITLSDLAALLAHYGEGT